jgi:FG-GAP-like repeat
MRPLCAVALLGILVSPSRGDGPQFRGERLRVPAGRVMGVHVEDLNGDGKQDLAAVFFIGKAPEPQRRLAVWFDHGARYTPEPDQVIELPRTAAFLDFADLDGDGKRALVIAEARGLSALRLEAGGKFEAAPKKFLQVVGLLALPDDDELPFFDVGRDWDGDGKAEILLPLTDGVAVFTRGETGEWARAATLKLQPRASYQIRTELYEPRLRNFTARATLVVPDLVTGDYDGDGKPDLYAVVEDLLQVHKGGGPQVFSPVAVARHYLGVRTEQETIRGAHVHTTVRDLDGDGIADLAVNKVAGGLGQMKAQTGFYYGRRGGGFDPPAQLLQRDGYAGSLAFADLDGDGKLDLVMPHVNVGLGEMARVLLSKKMRIGWEARRNLGKRQFSIDPTAVRDIDFAVDYSVVADIDGPYPSVEGDFNGDGKADFIAASGPEELAVWLGGGKTLLAPQPKAIVHATPSKYFHVVDLDGDKLADVVLFYRYKDALQGEIAVLRNTGHGW